MAITEDSLQSMFHTYFMHPRTVVYGNTVPQSDILSKCETLFRKDYEYQILSNTNGKLVSSYPRKIFLLEKEIKSSCNVQKNKRYNVFKIEKTIKYSRIARINYRVPLPVILYRGKSICRSSTISDLTEVVEIPKKTTKASTEPDADNNGLADDIRLLNLFSVGAICDLMLRTIGTMRNGRKSYSSEEFEFEHYEEFEILCLPYPAVDFFNRYHRHNYSEKHFTFDWNMPCVERILSLPIQTSRILNPRLQVHEYKTWNMTTLTLNYMKILLEYISEAKSGLLVHCRAGWDRTTLFISLLRLSLWADGQIHKSLTPLEILYMTLSYDWFLFGHTLSERMEHQEEILFFCFNILEHLGSKEYSTIKDQSNQSSKITTNPCIIHIKKDNPSHKHDYLPIASTSGQQTTSQQVAVDKSTLETCELMSLRKQKLKLVQITFYKMYINVLKTIYAPPSIMGLANDSYKYCVAKIKNLEGSPSSGSQLKKCNE